MEFKDFKDYVYCFWYGMMGMTLIGIGFGLFMPQDFTLSTILTIIGLIIIIPALIRKLKIEHKYAKEGEIRKWICQKKEKKH